MASLLKEGHESVVLFPLVAEVSVCGVAAVRSFLFLGRFEFELARVQVSCVVHEEIAGSLEGGGHRLSE